MMGDADLRCRCRLGCHVAATQEDMLCDVCRVPGHGHVAAAPVGTPVDGDGWEQVGLTRDGFAFESMDDLA